MGCGEPDTPDPSAPQISSTLVSVTKRPRARVTFVIDDGRQTDYTVKYPIFRARGAVAVAAVPSVWRELSDDQLLELQANGWEIANHGKNHRHEPRLSDEELTEELYDAKTAFEQIGLVVHAHVYPYGAFDGRVKVEASKYFRVGIGAWGGVNRLPLADRFGVTRVIFGRQYLDSLPRGSMPARHGVRGPYNLRWYTSTVDRAARQGAWVVFSIHEILPDDLVTLGKLIEYIQRRNIPIVTITQALDMP
jgi:peptidoglycan/xylan/chitin deacetylase (PgdA/CDA1 family)